MRVKPTKQITRLQSGFNLIELMIVIVIIGILAKVAVPAYNTYILQGKLTEATTNLSSTQAAMELYYQDNRTYIDVSSTITSPCDSGAMPTMKNFTMSCTATATTYTITATGANNATTGFVYSVNNTNTQSSTVGSVWGGSTYTCWIMKPSTTC